MHSPNRVWWRAGWTVILVAFVACGCGGKSKQFRFNKDDLLALKHVLVVGAGPITVKLDVGMAGKLLMKGLNKVLESDKGSSFAESLKELGLLPRETAMETGVNLLRELGWTATPAELRIDSSGKKFEDLKLPDQVCQEAVSAGADSALILYERYTIDVGATEALAKTELWAHLVACPGNRLIWRERDKRSLSLNRFIVHGAKQVITKKEKNLADFLSCLRDLVVESTRQVVTSGLTR